MTTRETAPDGRPTPSTSAVRSGGESRVPTDPQDPPEPQIAAPILRLDGQLWTGSRAPDPIGDIGAMHYVQAVNAPNPSEASSTVPKFVVFDKFGNQTANPRLMSELWQPPNTCQNTQGDPIVLYDALADRRFMSQIDKVGLDPPYALCVAVSTTGDPSGPWNGYNPSAMLPPSPPVLAGLPDFQKFGVWPDAYYGAGHESVDPGLPPPVPPPIGGLYALDRASMLAGAPDGPALFQRMEVPLASIPRGFPLPADLDGLRPPPIGAPGIFLRLRDDEVDPPPTGMMQDPATDYIDIWEYHVDWAVPANSTLSGPVSIAIADVDSSVCPVPACIPQPGPAGTPTLEANSGTLGWRVQYRNFVRFETLVGAFTVEAGGRAGIH